MSFMMPLLKHFTARFVVYEHDRSTVLFFYCLWLEAGGYFSSDSCNIFCLWSNWYYAKKFLEILALDKILSSGTCSTCSKQYMFCPQAINQQSTQNESSMLCLSVSL